MSSTRGSSAADELAQARAGMSQAMLALLIMSGLINVLALTGSIYMLQVYDRVLSSRSVPTLVMLSLIVAIAYLFQGALEILRSQASIRIAAVLEHRLAGTVNRLAMRRPLRGFSRADAQQPQRDLDTVRGFLAGGGPTAFLDLPWIPVYLAFVLLLHPAFGVMCIAGLAIIMLLTWLAELSSKSLVAASARADARRRAIADASLRNIEALQSMGFAERAGERYEAANRDFLRLQSAAGDRIAVLSGLSRLLRLLLQSAILGLGAYLVIHGHVTAGAIIAASIATTRAMAPLEQVIVHWRGFLAARQGYARLAAELAATPTMAAPLELPPPAGVLSLSGVSVCVPGTERAVVSAVDLELRAGQALALVGPSAAGKSSLARAITGLWPLQGGSIRLDGAELNRWTSASLGRSIGYLPQDVVLLQGSVADNICRLEQPRDDQAILAAARAAGVHEMILALPDGYETEVGPDGINLSAGQRQRIALARALYRDPFLVVLDEPNSNLDADGEAALTGAIHAVRRRGGIAIVIAHRPSALAAVDQVAMLSGGRLTVVGPTEETLKKILRQPIRAVGPTSS